MYTITFTVLAVLLVFLQWYPTAEMPTDPTDYPKLPAAVQSELQLGNDRLVNNNEYQMDDGSQWGRTVVFKYNGKNFDFIEKGSFTYSSNPPQIKNVTVSYTSVKNGIYNYAMVELIDGPRP